MEKLIVLVWLGAYVVFTSLGIRDRSGPRWLAVAGVSALILWIESDWWRISAGCVSSRNVAILLTWAGVVSVMFLHHIIQRPSALLGDTHPVSPRRLGTGGQLSTANTVVVRVLVFMPVAWSVLNAFRTFDREENFKERAIVMVQDCISWATLTLFLISAALTLLLLWLSYATQSEARH
jgi:hypothetical protein